MRVAYVTRIEGVMQFYGLDFRKPQWSDLPKNINFTWSEMFRPPGPIHFACSLPFWQGDIPKNWRQIAQWMPNQKLWNGFYVCFALHMTCGVLTSSYVLTPVVQFPVEARISLFASTSRRALGSTGFLLSPQRGYPTGDKTTGAWIWPHRTGDNATGAWIWPHPTGDKATGAWIWRKPRRNLEANTAYSFTSIFPYIFKVAVKRVISKLRDAPVEASSG
jgi:hypothetical protein